MRWKRLKTTALKGERQRQTGRNLTSWYPSNPFFRNASETACFQGTTQCHCDITVTSVRSCFYTTVCHTQIGLSVPFQTLAQFLFWAFLSVCSFSRRVWKGRSFRFLYDTKAPLVQVFLKSKQFFLPFLGETKQEAEIYTIFQSSLSHLPRDLLFHSKCPRDFSGY